MFWDTFYTLCKSNNKKPNPVAKELGFSSAAVTKWKNGSLPNLSAAADIAEYFHVTINELLYGLPSKCYRCGYTENPSNASFCKKCGNILHDNFCTNPNCDADGKNIENTPTLLSDDCEYCPYCGSQSKYKSEGLYEKDKKNNKYTSSDDMALLTLYNKLSNDEKSKVKGYIERIIDESVAADEPLKQAK